MTSIISTTNIPWHYDAEGLYLKRTALLSTCGIVVNTSLPPKRPNGMSNPRNISPDEFERWMSTDSRAHNYRLERTPEHLRPSFDLGQSIAMFVDGLVVGGAQSLLLEMSITVGAS